MEDDEQIDEVGIAIGDALMSEDLTAARLLFSKHPEYIGRYVKPWTWLQIAAKKENLGIVKFLLQLGCEVNAQDEYSPAGTALADALGKDNPAIVRLLLEHGANPNQDRHVIGAVVGNNRNSLEMIRLLEQYGADLHRVFLNHISGQPMNALSTAIDWGKKDVEEYLRSKGAVMPAPVAATNAPKILADDVVAYFSDLFGPVSPHALIEIVPSALPPIAVHVIPASQQHPHVTLFTTGLSSEAMNVPAGEDNYRYAELYIQMPASWNYQEIGSPKYGWPMRWLRTVAQYPHVNETWLGGAVTIFANGEPPEPLSPGLRFTCLLLLVEKTFVSRAGVKVQLYRMTPLYTEEREIEKREGVGALMQALDRYSTSFVVDVDRANVGLLA